MVMQVFAVLHHDTGSAFGLTFPDVPGCFAASDDLHALAEAAEDALSLVEITGEVRVSVSNLLAVCPNVPVEAWIAARLLASTDGMVGLADLCGLLQSRRG